MSFIPTRVKRVLSLVLVLSVFVPLTGCDMIIINDMSWDNMSNPETEKNNFPEETGYTPMEYTPYEPKEDYFAEAEGYFNDLPQRDFDGRAFFITTPSNDYIDPDDTGDTVNRMIFERNRKIEEVYNMSLITSLRPTDTILTEVKEAVASESYYTDLMMIPLYMTGRFRIEGVLANLRSLPFLDLSAFYFNDESVSMMSAGYETYGVAGHASISPSDFSAVFFNRDVVEEAGLEMPYSLVVAGEWTWDRFFEYTDAVSSLNGETENQFQTVGVQNNASRLADIIFISCGNDFINAASRKVPKISFSQRSAEYAVTAAHRIITDPYAVVDASADVIGQFAEGNMLFLCEYLSVIPQIAESNADWGILPIPLQKENDLYRTLISNNELIFTVPRNHTDGEFVSVILSALNAGSYGYLYEEYVNNLLVYTLQDNDSANMLELIFDTAAFDFALAFGNAYPAVAEGTYGLIRKSAIENDLAARFDAAEEAANKALSEDFNLEY